MAFSERLNFKNVDLEAMEMESKSSKFTFDTTVVYI